MSLLVGTTAGAFSLGDTTEEQIGGTRINHITRDATGWWAVDGKGRIHHDGQVVATLPDGSAALCVRAGIDTVWIGSNEARLFAFDHDTVSEDEFFANAPDRDTWYTPWGAPADVRSMTFDADHTLYVNVHVGGILRYDNTGLVPTVDISADVHEVTAHPTQKGAVFAATAQGLAASHNGHDFEFRSNGLRTPRTVALSPSSMTVSSSPHRPGLAPARRGSTPARSGTTTSAPSKTGSPSGSTTTSTPTVWPAKGQLSTSGTETVSGDPTTGERPGRSSEKVWGRSPASPELDVQRTARWG